MEIELESILIDEQNLEIVSKTKEFEFSAKFAWKLKFFENRGKFELKFSYCAAINSIRGIKFLSLYFIILFSPSLGSLTPSQTDESEIGEKLLPEPNSQQNYSF